MESAGNILPSSAGAGDGKEFMPGSGAYEGGGTVEIPRSRRMLSSMGGSRRRRRKSSGSPFSSPLLTPLLLLLLLTLPLVPLCSASLDLYLTQWEVRRLLGLNRELFYVRDGIVNEYALNFTITVPANIVNLYFTWQSLSGEPLPYSMAIDISDPAALSTSSNVSLSGGVPTTPQTFMIALPCSGDLSAEVNVTLRLNVTLGMPGSKRNITSLVFKRKKICLRVKETAKTASYLGVILFGVGVTGFILFTLFKELFSSNSPNGIYTAALDRCRKDPRVADLLGEPIKGFGEETRRGRR